MIDTEMDVASYFTAELPRVMDDFVLRPEQVALAENIDSVIKNGDVAVFEAGTGTGKTLSYLVPALASEQTVIISTGTRTLQDQLYLKDMPVISKFFTDRRVSILKGRANYVCPHRLEVNLKVLDKDARYLPQLTRIKTWAASSDTGDLGEILPGQEDASFLHLVTSTRDNCLGRKCPRFDRCPLYRAREIACQSDIVVVNHHLLFADLAQKEENLTRLLPEAGAVIVDEAHQVPEIARQFFGQRITSGQLVDLVRDIRNELVMLGGDDPATLFAVNRVENATAALRSQITAGSELDFNEWVDGAGHDRIHDVDYALDGLREQLITVAARSEGLSQCLNRTANFADQFAWLTERSEPSSEYVHWIDRRERGFVIHLSPLSVAKEMHAVTSQPHQAWVFTSATLAINKGFDHFTSALGLTDAITAIFESPFDYPSRVRAYLPGDLPEPGSSEHTAALIDEVSPIIDANPGRTFMLFTSYRALNQAAGLMKDSSRPVFTQGHLPRNQLLMKFREETHSILLATQSFWEGVDVRGADLKCLVIDKLPFPNPDDPLFHAEAEIMERDGGNSFVQLSLPRAALSLKQGFGRLIREEEDSGLFIIGDVRLGTRSYRDFILENLPAMSWVEDRDEAIDWLQRLAAGKT